MGDLIKRPFASLAKFVNALDLGTLTTKGACIRPRISRKGEDSDTYFLPTLVGNLKLKYGGS
jgi:hypothetical protein